MDFYSAAAPLAERGFRVYQADIDKEPTFVRGVQQHGFDDATTELPRLAELNTADATANVGVKTGTLLPNGLYLHVLDGDRHPDAPDGVAALAPFHLDDYGGPKVKTPQNGNHWYFTSPIILPHGKIAALPGAECNSRGGVLVPTSRTAAGIYEWIRDLSAPIPVLPDELRAVILQAQAHQVQAEQDETPGTTFSSVIRRLERAERGQRNDELNRAAFMCGRLVQAGHLDEQEAKDTLQDVAASLGLWSEEFRKTDRTIERGLADGKQARGSIGLAAERVQAMRRLQDAARAPWPGRTGVTDAKTYTAVCLVSFTSGSDEVDASTRRVAELANVSASTASTSLRRHVDAGRLEKTSIAGAPLKDVDGALIVAARSYRLTAGPAPSENPAEMSTTRSHIRLSETSGAENAAIFGVQSAEGAGPGCAEAPKTPSASGHETDMCATFAQFSASLPRLMAHDAFSWGGLGATAAQVYAALLDGGPLTVSELVTQTGRSRSGVYVVLERLSNLVDETTGEVFSPLVRKVGKRWEAVPCDLDELAVFLHVDGRQAKRKAQHEHERAVYRKLCTQNVEKERLKQPAPTAGTHQAKRGDAERQQATAAHAKTFVSPRQQRLTAWRELQRQMEQAERELGLVRGEAPRRRHQAVKGAQTDAGTGVTVVGRRADGARGADAGDFGQRAVGSDPVVIVGTPSRQYLQ